MSLSIHPLCVGINQTDQGIMTYQRGYGQRIFLPIYMWLIKGASRTILVDTGMEEFMVPEGTEEELGFPILEFEEALDRHGLTPEKIDLLIQTHLHNDHCENTYKCTNAEILVQQVEWDFASNPHPLDHRYFPDLVEDMEPTLIQGDYELEPGLDLLFTPGHTPGGQSVAVQIPSGKAIITGFCCNAKNFPASGPAVCPGVHTDALVAFDSAQKVKKEADIILACHDPAWGSGEAIS